MALGPRLDLRTSQTLVISPQLQTAIRLLALSNLELTAELAAELDRNPLLELAGDAAGSDGPDHSGMADGADPEAVPADSGASVGMDQELRSEGAAEHAEDQDVDYIAERFHHDSAADSGRASGDDTDFSFDNFEAQALSLHEILERQVLGLAETDRHIARHIIAVIDDAGYLTESLAQIAVRTGLKPADIERVLGLVQGFEPTGVGARDLGECIALQAREADRYDPCMAVLIDNLDLVARGDFVRLQRLCDVDAEDLRDMLHELRHYDPKPGLVHGGGGATPIVPDVFVHRTGNGLRVELNSTTLPRLIVNRHYEAAISRHAAAAPDTDRRSEQRFLNQCLSQAHWLLKALDQRAQTILRVATAIVERQRKFFDHGAASLVPLTLREIGEELELHESTVSRVTSNKYLSCARGTFELKYFFTTAIAASDGGDSASAEAVRQKLKSLVDAEEPMNPLSDSHLARMLNDAGFDVARRTVAKYREAMSIPASFDRRRRARLEQV